MDAFALIMITIPIFYPVILFMGYDPIWYGVMMVLITEMAVITPPFGLNCFVISGISGVPIGTVFRGILPFIFPVGMCAFVLIFFPSIATWLPSLMMTY